MAKFSIFFFVAETKIVLQISSPLFFSFYSSYTKLFGRITKTGSGSPITFPWIVEL